MGTNPANVATTSTMQSPEAREYDEVQTPDSGRKRGRQFGVQRRKYGGGQRVVENARDGRETAAFAHARRTAIGRHSHVEDFSFGDDVHSHHRLEHGSNGTRVGVNGHGGKYIQQPRTAIRPGASIMGESSTSQPPPPRNEEEMRLRQLGSPPRKLDSFAETILNKSRRVSMTAKTASSRVQALYTNTKRGGSSLESASAPTSAAAANKTAISSVSSRDNWKAPVRIQRDAPTGSKRARVELTPTHPRRIPVASKESATTVSGATRASARIQSRPTRNKFGMYDSDESPSNASVASRYGKKNSQGSFFGRASDGGLELPLRRSTRSSPKPKDGTEEMPIHLSDSEDEEDLPTPKDQETTRAENQSDDDKFEMGDGRQEAVLECQGIRAWFGEFACHIDVSVGRDQLSLCSIRGVESKWPFEQNFRIQLNRIKRILAYRWTPDQVGTVDTSDPAGKVMSTTSFTALQFPIPVALRKLEWRKFYDPDADKESSKRFLILLAKDDDKAGTTLSAIEDVISQRHGELSVESLNTLDDVRSLAKAMIEHDHHYVFRDPPQVDEPRRSRRKREVQDEGMDATQLTYPLPPCTVDVVTITRQDIARLQPAEYLNDNIIDYYLKRLLIVDYASNELLKQNVLFLSSHFYSRLRAGKGTTMKERLEAGYKNVSTWLSRSDLFSRTLVFVPINKDLHWSLAVIVNPKCAGTGHKCDDEDEQDDAPQTCIALLDPLGGYHSSIPILRNLKSFLNFEWEQVFGAKSFEQSRVAKLQVSAPLQSNSYDCGVFVLKYAQEMLANFATMLGGLEPDKKSIRDGFVMPRSVTDDGLAGLIPHNAFTSRDVKNKRKELQAMLEEDTKAYNEALIDAKVDTKRLKAET